MTCPSCADQLLSASALAGSPDATYNNATLQLAERTDVVPGLAEDADDLQLGERRIGLPIGRGRVAAIERRKEPVGVI